MACVTSTHFAILINVTLTSFFHTSRGIIQGFALSPLLFLLVIEGLSRLISVTKDEGKIKGIKLSSLIFITRLLFVNDVVLFGNGSMEECHCFV